MYEELLKRYQQRYNEIVKLLKGLSVTAITEQAIDVQLVAVAKDLILPTDFRVGNQVTDGQANRIIFDVFEDDFIKHVSTQSVSDLTGEFPVQGLDEIVFQRGEIVGSKVHQKGYKLNLLHIDVAWDYTLQFLRTNRNNPNIVAMLAGQFMKAARNNAVMLGFLGVSESGEGETKEEAFPNLNEGWIYLARQSTNTPKYEINAPSIIEIDWLNELPKIAMALPERYRKQAVYIMNDDDALAYATQIGLHVVGEADIATTVHRTLLAKKIVTSPHCPRGTVLFTNPKNLVYAMHTLMRRDSSYKARKNGGTIENTLNMANDYQIQLKEALVLAEYAGAAPPPDPQA